MAKIVLVCGMVNTGNFFNPLATALEQRGHTVHLSIGTHRPSSSDDQQGGLSYLIENADLVLSGMSNPADFAGLELFALSLAYVRNVPFGFLSDANGAWRREYFQNFADKASLLAVRFPHEVALAERIFPNATIASVGHPTAEKASSAKFTREKLRKRLGLADSELVVYLAGTKMMDMNREAITLVTQSIKQFSRDFHIRFLFGPHPGITGEKARKDGKEVSLDEYRNWSENIEFVPDVSGEDIVPAADAFLFTTGPAFYAAIYQGDQGALAVLLNSPKIAAIRGTSNDLSFECETGAIVPVASADALAAVLGNTIYPYPAVLQANRRVYWPKPEREGAAVDALAILITASIEARFTEHAK